MGDMDPEVATSCSQAGLPMCRDKDGAEIEGMANQ
ncbi:hypothetical protein T03_17751 [Trichinella britovi]|uniref:Uncharacterized protein n=1 Tax=Trichinella britovi TaxID=45882 RepID=A0A0V0Z099_TRIBR|nr:hypothetical protein T03_17751 [Trichinella britovi]